MGYMGGTLTCSTTCTPDTRGCFTCGTDSRIVACNEALDCSQVQSLALAASDASVAVAWATIGTSQRGGLFPGSVGVAILGADLTPLARKTVATIHNAQRVAIARAPSGWLLAVGETDPAAQSYAIEVIPLDEGGNVRAASLRIEGASGPFLWSRGSSPGPGAGPLLVWSEGYTDRFAAVFGDGTTMVSPPFDMSRGLMELEPDYVSAAYTGTAFLYAERFDGGRDDAGVFLARATVAKIGLDGSLQGLSHPAGNDTAKPQIAWLGDHAVLSYAEFATAWTMNLLSLDANGAAVGAPVSLGAAYARSPPVALSGGGAAILLGAMMQVDDHSPGLSVARLSAQGALGTAFAIAKDPGNVTSWRAIARGPDMIVAWIGDTQSYAPNGYLHIARVTP
jgi:hypothetical protein